jgi:Leucine-rich repeat (LRR) protein/GTPase SAR1 family protein
MKWNPWHKRNDQFKALVTVECTPRHKEWLFLDHCDLVEIPEDIFELESLVSISLVGNKLRFIPDRLRDLPNLKQIVLLGNPIKVLPDLPGVTIVIDSSIYLRCRSNIRPESIHLVLDPKTQEKDGSSWAEELCKAGIRSLAIRTPTLNPSSLWNHGNSIMQDLKFSGNFYYKYRFNKSLKEIDRISSLKVIRRFSSFKNKSTGENYTLTPFTLGDVEFTFGTKFPAKHVFAINEFNLDELEMPPCAECNWFEGGLRDLIIRDTPSPAITKVLDSLENLKLDQLALSYIHIKAVPEGIRYLQQLKSLSMHGLNLKDLPEWIGELELARLSIAWNDISTLPDCFRGLEQLQFLRLDFNPLKNIQAVVFDLPSLEKLHVNGCEISEIPADILRLDKLKTLGINYSKIGTPPPEVAIKGLYAIRDYWRQRADNGVDYLYEAKVIILGEAGAGKTSLARKIENPQYKLQAQEKSTEGIDVIRHHFTSRINPKQQKNEKLLEHQFRANIWDFGGQEIYHATHQFFLTRRSVYVLVCDDRKEDTDFSYWLHVVEMLSDASPLLIVQNEKQDRKRDINLGGLRARFSNLKQALATNLETNRGLDQVIQAIRNELESLEHVGVGLPATWKRVREALEKDDHDFISLQDYLEICQQYGFTRHEDKLQLSGYLHDLGICLHFQNDPLLKNTVVLNPAWGTDAVYRVLDDAEVIAAHGYFTRTQLSRIWSEAKYTGMQDELLRLMMKFQLCYALESGQSFIAPQLLTSNQPSYPWN